jgi:hypothetical protein
VEEKDMVKEKQSFSRARIVALFMAVALAMLGLGGSNASADEPIVGLWMTTVSAGGTVVDQMFRGWTSDGSEFDQDNGLFLDQDNKSPILAGYVCYGHWIKLEDRTYGLTHPYFEYDPSTGIWAGTSGYFNYTVTVSRDGTTFTGKENGKFGVPGPNPYATGGTPFSGLTVSATKIKVDKSLLP